MIIAVVPAKGHEYLVADGPMGERPALLRRGVTKAVEGVRGIWLPDNGSRAVGLRALVLYAPGDPRLGMLRALAAIKAGINVWRERSLRPPKDDVRAVAATHPDTTKVVVPTPPGLPDGALRAFGLAHLLVQRGIASEVIVIEPADKAKE